MNQFTPLWLGLALAGFLVGLWTRPMVLLRMAIGLFLLGGLGLLLSNTMGLATLSWWFGAGMVAIAVMFGAGIVGSIAAWAVRRMVHADPRKRVRVREHNSILE